MLGCGSELLLCIVYLVLVLPCIGMRCWGIVHGSAQPGIVELGGWLLMDLAFAKSEESHRLVCLYCL